jgi:hypothetical protein
MTMRDRQMTKNDTWHGLEAGDGRRIDAAGKFDFFWAILEQNTPALILRLTENIDDTAALPKLKNIELKFRTLDRKVLALRLLDGSQRDIFHTLCLDVVYAAEQALTLPEALERAIRRTRRWNFLLRSGGKAGMSLEEQRGLVGELCYLGQLSAELGPNAAIDAWKGPEGASKDFEFPELCIEIKARRGASKPHVRISSEDQLADVAGAKLYLRVYDVDSAVLPEGESLHDYVRNAAALFENDDAAFERWQELIAATGYDDSDDYAQRRWVLGLARSFEVIEGFPRLAAPLPYGVANVAYAIALGACEPFRCVDIPATLILKGSADG